MAKILIVEDDRKLRDMVNDLMTMERYETEVTDNGRDALHLMRTFPYDLIVLDWQLPHLSGIEICREFRSAGYHTPILLLTGKRDPEEKEQGLDAGADDYVTKPFNARELCARVRALLRRPPTTVDPILHYENLMLDPQKYLVTKAGQPIHLPPREFRVLEFFMRHPGQMFSADALMDRIWKADDSVTKEGLRVCIGRLRSKIDDAGAPSMINAVYGAGYKFEKIRDTSGNGS
jgi:two-component system, OmpR family, response regulator